MLQKREMRRWRRRDLRRLTSAACVQKQLNQNFQYTHNIEGSNTIPNHVNGWQDFGIRNLKFLVKLCNSPYIINHVTCISKFGKQESLESSQESWNQVNIPKDLESCRWKSVVSDSLHNTQSDMRKPCLCSYKQVKCMLLLDIIKSVTLIQ